MSDVSNYIKNKLNQFCKEHDVPGKLNRYDGELQRQWKHDRDRTKMLWQEIMTESDVHDYIDRFVSSVEREANLNTLCLETYSTDLALYRAVYAMEKMAQCYNNKNCQFNTIDINAIDIMFNKLEQAHQKMKDELMRRTMR